MNDELTQENESVFHDDDGSDFDDPGIRLESAYPALAGVVEMLYGLPNFGRITPRQLAELMAYHVGSLGDALGSLETAKRAWLIQHPKSA